MTSEQTATVRISAVCTEGSTGTRSSGWSYLP